MSFASALKLFPLAEAWYVSKKHCVLCLADSALPVEVDKRYSLAMKEAVLPVPMGKLNILIWST